MGRDVIAIGTFDGVHRGHQSVLAIARHEAHQAGGHAVAYAFDVPPRVAAGDDATRLLLPPDVKRRLLRTWVDRIVEPPFGDVQNLSPDEFVEDVLVRDLGAGTVVVGAGFRFGRGRSGDASTLARLAQDARIQFVLVPPVAIEGNVVSSTRIRMLLTSGDVAAASALLGRPPLLRGEVVPGDAIGRTLGFPTANLRLDPRLLRPRAGIYLSRAYYETARSEALTYCGSRPTLNDPSPRCEVHLLETPPRELRGVPLEVHLYALLRPDRAFSTLGELREQMERDREDARIAVARFPEAADPDPFG